MAYRGANPYTLLLLAASLLSFCIAAVALRHESRRVAFPLVAYGVILTNPWHQLWRQGETFAPGTPPPVLVEVRGPLWYLWAAYAYGIVLLSLYYLARELLERRQSRTYQTQAALVMLGILVPAVANLFFTVGGLEFDPAPPTFVLMGLIFAVAIVRYRILDITPIARDVVLESLDNGVLVLDRDDRIADANPVAKRVLGLEDGEVPGVDLASALHDRPEFLTRFEDVRETNETVSVDTDDGVRHYTVEISPVDDPLGGSFGRVVVFTDVTGEVDRKRRLRERTERLRRQNERLDEFASIVSHDLRNPLELVRANLRLSRETGDEQYLDRIDDGVDRMEKLIDELLVLARQGRTIEEPEPVDLGSVATLSWNGLRTEDATLDNGLQSVTVLADEPRLRHAFENLFRNAIEHNDGEVTVVLGPLDDEAGFFVADDGEGIPEHDREAVFERGYSTDDDGTGIGSPSSRKSPGPTAGNCDCARAVRAGRGSSS